MSKIRKFIAITVGAIAVLAVATIIALSCITVSPVAHADGWMKEPATVSIYRAGERLSVSSDGKLVGKGELSEQYTYDDVIDSMNFSLFSALLQFNYDYGLKLYDNKVASAEISEKEVKTETEKVKNGELEGFSFIISFADERTLSLTDGSGKTVEQTYDTVVFTITEDSEWAKNLTAYVYDYSDVYGSSDDYEQTTYYKLSFGAKTSTAVDILTACYGEEIEEPETEEGEGEGEEN